MTVHWTIASLPELGHLSRRDASRVIRRCIRPGLRIRLWLRPVMLALCGMICVTLLLLAVGTETLARVAGLPSFVLFYLVLHVRQVRSIQSELRTELAKLLAGGRALSCLVCGFDLGGTDSPRCPECGAGVYFTPISSGAAGATVSHPPEARSMPTDRTINYVELPGADLDALEEFYHAAFGWTFTPYGDDYRAFNDGEFDGGFHRSDKRSETANGSALIVLFATDLEATHERVLAAGGRTEKEIFSFPGGRRFHFRDPHGNELAVWSDT